MSRSCKVSRMLAGVLLASGLLACGGGGGGAGSSPRYTVSGRVKTFGGAGAAGVTVQLAGGASAITDANGSYAFGDLSSGSYTLTPSKSTYEFAPASITAVVSDADVSGQDFTMGSGRWGQLIWSQDRWK